MQTCRLAGAARSHMNPDINVARSIQVLLNDMSVSGLQKKPAVYWQRKFFSLNHSYD